MYWTEQFLQLSQTAPLFERCNKLPRQLGIQNPLLELLGTFPTYIYIAGNPCALHNHVGSYAQINIKILITEATEAAK